MNKQITHFTQHRVRYLLPMIGILWLLLIFVPVQAQNQPPDNSYWRYAAARRLTHVIPVDINHDGVTEFLVAAENGKIDLINANNATLEWDYEVGNVIQALSTVNIDGDEHPQREVMLVSDNQLILLDYLGNELWRTQMTAVDPPPAKTSADDTTIQNWYAQFDLDTRQISPIDTDGDGSEEILILFETGQLQLYDGNGNLLRRLNNYAIPNADTLPKLQVGDLNQDGRDEIILGMFNTRKKFSEVYLFSANGREIWDDPPPISGQITDISLVPFGPNNERQIAISSNRGQIHLYDINRQRQWWPRTLNKPITTMTVTYHADGPVLLAGTNVGMVVAYNSEGRRLWSRRLTNDADRSVIGISTIPFIPEQRTPAVAVMLSPSTVTGGNQLIKLLDISGLEVGQYETSEDATPLSHLLDINGDLRSELLLTRFANVELQGLGAGASEIAKEWDYSLDAEPGAVLVVDFDNDGRDELLLGGQNGKLHYLINGTNLEWLQPSGGAINHLALFERGNVSSPAIVVGRNDLEADLEDPDTAVSWIELHNTKGERLWEYALTAHVTAVAVKNMNTTNDPEIIVGTSNGDIIILNNVGSPLWQTNINNTTAEEEPEAIKSLIPLDAPNGEPRIIAATENHLYATTIDTDLPPPRIATFDSNTLQDIFPLNQPGVELANRLFILTDNVFGLNWRGISLPPWPIRLEGTPLTTIPANDNLQNSFETDQGEAFLISTDNNELVRLTIQDNQPEIQWTLTNIPDVTSMYWGDLDGNRLPEFAVGDSKGNVQLYTSVPQPRYLDELTLTSGVFAMTALQRGSENRADLLIVTENGEVQIFSTQENHPPLLTNPSIDTSDGQYGFNIAVSDVEKDDVFIRLDIQDPETGLWVSQRETTVANGNGPVLWNVLNPPVNGNGVHYRFYYSDDLHSGFIYPPMGPVPTVQIDFLSDPAIISVLVGLVILGVIVVTTRQLQSPSMRTRRFYWRLKRWPAETLLRLENRYVSTNGSPDFLLSLSGLARQREDNLISTLADGLFLLADRPLVGLPIIIGALEEATQLEPKWQEIDRWLLIFRTGHELLTVPTITELGLEQTQLEEVLGTLEKQNYWAPSFHLLLPVLRTIRDSERVEQTDDRLIYLSEAQQQLDVLTKDFQDYAPSIEKPLAIAIVNRWAGLISAAREEIRGRAFLTITLKTKRLVPDEPSQVTFELENTGRAAAENLIAVLDDDPAYASAGMPVVVSFLPPGQTRLVSFDLRPLVTDRFRVGMTVTFDDRNRIDKRVAFGDQVHLLQPQLQFTPIPNQYRPGTPLRQNSAVFYGRQRLFNFITENAGSWSQRNVLILIGQRRTGKTSALLNLEQHLPPHLLPVYIDCQSLGVMPGMAALFHDWAWLIADALLDRDIEIEVPELDTWEADPVGQFQRQFLPAIRQLLPHDTTLLLVFDEFEVFEHLVNDGILPPTFFNFLRHLMQHSDGLSFVFVGTRHLEEMSADYWSVLFNIALYQRITYLREESAIQLITDPVSPNLVYDDLALDKILRVTAGHPYFLQLVCYTLVKQANQQRKAYVTISDVNAALDEMLSLGEVHFAYLWQRSSFTERAILTAVSHMLDHDRPFHPEDFVQFLDPYGIHLHPTEVTAALNTLVEREIMRELPDGATTQYELRLGLVGLWTAQHKSLSKLHATKTNGTTKNGTAKPKKLTTDF